MTFLQKFISGALVATIKTTRKVFGDMTVRAGFEAVRQTWGERSWLFQTLQDSWLEIDAMTRKELQRIHEYLISNASIVQKIRRLYIQFSVGPSGLICTPNASRYANGKVEDAEDWNHSRSESWATWWKKPELNSEISGNQLTRLWSGMLFDKGEIFVLLTFDGVKDPRGVVVTRTPKVKTLDAHLCESPFNKNESNGNRVIDGREFTPDGKTVAYWFKKQSFDNSPGVQGGEVYERIEVLDKAGRKQLIHKYEMLRPNQPRGIPKGFSVYNIVRDNLDLHKLEMQAAKLASDIANVETNASGELSTLSTRRANLGITTQKKDGTLETKNEFADYKVSIGSKNLGLKMGSSLNQFMISRPTVATQDYWDLHYTMICLGYNIPKLLVMPYSMQGTVTRADLDVSGYGFGREHFELIAELLREVYEWQTEWAVNFDRTMDGETPEDFTAVSIRPPRAPNVDVGYNAAALEKELMLGIKTVPDVYAERQQDFRQKTREIAEYLKFVKETAEEFGVDATTMTSLLAPKISSAHHLDPAETDEPVEGQPTKKTAPKEPIEK